MAAVLNQIDILMLRDPKEKRKFWRHPRFDDLGLLKAHFRQHRYDRHTHATYVIALITGGCERVTIGRQSLIAPTGSLILVNPEEWHDGQAGADDGWTYRTLYPGIELLSEIAKELGQVGAPVFTRSIVHDNVLARAIEWAHRTSEDSDTMAAETTMLVALRQLMFDYSDQTARPEAVEISGAHHRLSLYKQVIEANIACELDLQRLADAARVSRFQVIRDFKKTAGLTPATFIRDRRVRRASSLIKDGWSLADAALGAGFADQSHLSRTFRSAYGITPGMFKSS